MKFKSGDKVRIIASKERLKECSIYETPLTGELGEIISVDKGMADGLDHYTQVGNDIWYLAEQDLELAVPEKQPAHTFIGHPNGELEVTGEVEAVVDEVISGLIPVSHKNYMSLSDAYDKHSRHLMNLKGEEYSIDGDFLAMENRLAGMLGDTPEYVSLVMAGKHIAALGIILLKNDPDEIKLAKLDERVRDATNLLKIMAAFVHAKQSDFLLHLGKEEVDRTTPVEGEY